MSEETVQAGRRRVAISHADRVVFPEVGLTKLDLARHYAAVGRAMVPHVRGRPLALQVFPKGIEGEGHFLKDAPRHFPDWITTVAVPKREGGTIRQVLADDVPASSISPARTRSPRTCGRAGPTAWSSPTGSSSTSTPRAAASAPCAPPRARLGSLLRDLGLEPFAMTTGSRGLRGGPAAPGLPATAR